MVNMDSLNKALAEGGWFNPLNPNSDKHLISPYSITGWSDIQVMRIKKMITKDKMSWCLSKFSQLVCMLTLGLKELRRGLCTVLSCFIRSVTLLCIVYFHCSGSCATLPFTKINNNFRNRHLSQILFSDTTKDVS